MKRWFSLRDTFTAKKKMSSLKMKQTAEPIWFPESHMLYAAGTNAALTDRTMRYHCHAALLGLPWHKKIQPEARAHQFIVSEHFWTSSNIMEHGESFVSFDLWCWSPAVVLSVIMGGTVGQCRSQLFVTTWQTRRGNSTPWGKQVFLQDVLQKLLKSLIR